MDLGDNDGDDLDGRYKRTRRGRRRSSRRPRERHVPTYLRDYHLLASLYLDGRETVERAMIVYLDADHPDYRADRGGKTYLQHRWVRTKDGRIVQHSWVFKEVGIETLLDKMLVKDDPEAAAAAQDGEDDLIAALGSAGLDDKEETKKLGQIEVRFTRVMIQEPHYSRDFPTVFREGDNDAAGEETTTMDLLDGLTHTSA